MIKNGTSHGLNPIPQSFRKLWDVWDLRVCILVSLGLQTFLILFGSLRKRKNSKLIIILIWLAYLLADWVAAFVLGLISNNNENDSRASANTEDLLAFWAPFLLLHLGGPDTITAFALEDNELWLRHLLGLVFQFFAAGYIFLQTLPNNKLWMATSLMFLAALIKYAERTRSLYRASLGRFRDSLLTDPDPGPNYAKLMAEYSSMKEANLPARIEMKAEPKASSNDHRIEMQIIEGKEKVQRAYEFFQIFKGLIVDMIFSFNDRSTSRDYFLRRNAEDAFEVIEIELSFIYEVLYTKAVVVHSWRGFIFRIVAFSSTLISLLLFLSHKKIHLPEFDVIVTYMLLIGAMILDVIALVMLIFSDWTVAAEKGSRVNNIITAIVTKVPIPRTPRWSESLSQLNLISYSLSKRPEFVDRVFAGSEDSADEILYKSRKPVTKQLKEFVFGMVDRVVAKLGLENFADKIWSKSRKPVTKELKEFIFGMVDRVVAKLGLEDFADEIWYKSRNPVTKGLKKFIFGKLKEKSMNAKDPKSAKETSSARGDGVLGSSNYCKDLGWSVEVDYDESLLLWHIATEILYQCIGSTDTKTDESHSKDTKTDESHSKDTKTDESHEINTRGCSKLLSDYMLYLLVMQPTMMLNVGGIGRIRFRDTCAEAKVFYRGHELKGSKDACDKLFEVNIVIKPADVKGDRSKSVLFDGVRLAKDLQTIAEKETNEKAWELIGQVWLELLCYAAIKCRGNSHAQQVSKGGELLTFVWLLMTHLGLGEQFRIEAGHARAKLIVEK